MSPPKMAPWNLGLRFLLEMAALVGIAALAWQLGDGIMAWTGAIVAPIVGAAAWGLFNVADDPSRSGRAPIPVPGWIRLGLELTVFVGGAIGFGIAWGRSTGIAVGVLVLVHSVASYRRVRWLVRR